jgi:two-component system alkaline phosphatase synthesis response regulator PhoP
MIARGYMRAKVLIAEDYADVRRMTKLMLEKCGYDVIEAQDGFEAFEQAKQHHPDIILMDIAMPLINGITATRLIRSQHHCENIPIIAVTAYGKDYPVGSDYGFDDVVAKPVDIEKLDSLVSSHLRKRQETEH